MMSRIVPMLAGIAVCSGVAAQPRESPQIYSDAYQANLDSFDRITCRYTITAGYAKTTEDALAGKFILEKCEVGKAIWLKRGSNSVVRLEEDPRTKQRLDNPKLEQFPGHPGLLIGPGSYFQTTRFLTNGKQSLTYEPRMRSASLAQNLEERPFDETPFRALWYGTTSETLPGLARDVMQGKRTAAITNETINGRQLVQLRFADSEGSENIIGVDPERGFLPIRRRFLANKEEWGQADVFEVRDCGNGRWFPMRSLFIQTKHDPPGIVGIYECKVTELDTETLPAESDISIELPAGTMVLNHDKFKERFETRRVERIHPDDLEHIMKMAAEAPTNPVMDTAIEPPHRKRWMWWVAGGVGAVLLLLIVALVLRRRGAIDRTPPPVQS